MIIGLRSLVSVFLYLLFFWCNNNNILQADTILHAHIKLATMPPPLQQHTPPTALAIQRAPCGDTPRGTDGDAAWRGERSRRNARVDQGGKSASSSFACVSTWQQKRIFLLCLIPKRGKAGEGAACPLPIGGHRSNAPRRGRGEKG